MSKTVSRPEDMSATGELKLIKQDDGDIIVVVKEEDHGGWGHSVEFCNSGTRSRRTFRALQNLFRAMEYDNNPPPPPDEEEDYQFGGEGRGGQ